MNALEIKKKNSPPKFQKFKSNKIIIKIYFSKKTESEISDENLIMHEPMYRVAAYRLTRKVKSKEF